MDDRTGALRIRIEPNFCEILFKVHNIWMTAVVLPGGKPRYSAALHRSPPSSPGDLMTPRSLKRPVLKSTCLLQVFTSAQLKRIAEGEMGPNGQPEPPPGAKKAPLMSLAAAGEPGAPGAPGAPAEPLEADWPLVKKVLSCSCLCLCVLVHWRARFISCSNGLASSLVSYQSSVSPSRSRLLSLSSPLAHSSTNASFAFSSKLGLDFWL